jgi:hypothetical protein
MGERDRRLGWDSRVAVRECGFRRKAGQRNPAGRERLLIVALDFEIHFLSMDWNVSRRLDAEFDDVPVKTDHLDRDTAIDDQALAGLS